MLIITGHSLDQCCQHSAQVWILEWCHCSHKHGTGCPSQAGSQPLHHGQSLCSKGKFLQQKFSKIKVCNSKCLSYISSHAVVSLKQLHVIWFFFKIQKILKKNKWMKINWKQNTFAECFSYEIHIWNSHCWRALEMIFILTKFVQNFCLHRHLYIGWENYADY